MIRADRPKIAFPHDLTGEIERKEATRPERYVDALAIGGGRGRGMSVLEVRT